MAKKLELLDEKLEVSLGGESHEMRLPTNKELLDLSTNRDDLEDNEKSMDVMFSFLEGLGLPKDFTAKMTPNHIVKVMEAVSDTKG